MREGDAGIERECMSERQRKGDEERGRAMKRERGGGGVGGESSYS